MLRDVAHRLASALAHDNRQRAVMHLHVGGGLRREILNGTLTLARYVHLCIAY